MRRDFGHYSNVQPADWPWQSFSPKEVACKGTGNLVIDTQAMDMLQRLRTNLGKPLVITSAYRSPEHNRNVGGAKRSKHMESIAFDVVMANHDPAVFEAAARAVGFTSFGYYQKSNFMHIDCRTVGTTWGKPWPITATTWPTEPPRQPEKLSEDKEAQAAAGAGVAGAVAVAADYLPILGQLAPTAQLVAVVVAAASIGYLLWRRSR
jgi:zinc D-Ala-D-Ala carboxypeptidase